MDLSSPWFDQTGPALTLVTHFETLTRRFMCKVELQSAQLVYAHVCSTCASKQRWPAQVPFAPYDLDVLGLVQLLPRGIPT